MWERLFWNVTCSRLGCLVWRGEKGLAGIIFRRVFSSAVSDGTPSPFRPLAPKKQVAQRHRASVPILIVVVLLLYGVALTYDSRVISRGRCARVGVCVVVFGAREGGTLTSPARVVHRRCDMP